MMDSFLPHDEVSTKAGQLQTGGSTARTCPSRLEDGYALFNSRLVNSVELRQSAMTCRSHHRGIFR